MSYAGGYQRINEINSFLKSKDSNLEYKIDKVVGYNQSSNVATVENVESLKAAIVNYLMLDENNSVELGVEKSKNMQFTFIGSDEVKTTNKKRLLCPHNGPIPMPRLRRTPLHRPKILQSITITIRKTKRHNRNTIPIQPIQPSKRPRPTNS